MTDTSRNMGCVDQRKKKSLRPTSQQAPTWQSFYELSGIGRYPDTLTMRSEWKLMISNPFSFESASSSPGKEISPSSNGAPFATQLISDPNFCCVVADVCLIFARFLLEFLYIFKSVCMQESACTDAFRRCWKSSVHEKRNMVVKSNDT